MNWFYANAGQQVGPINEADFERLVREGVIQPATLVWREGMVNWEPYSSVASAPSPIPTVTPLAAGPAVEVPAGQAICYECNKLVPAEEAMQIHGRTVCAACKPVYLQKMREGALPQTTTRYGGFWIRLGAYMIDQVILGVVQLPLTILFSVRMQQALQGGFDWASYFANLGLSSALSMIISLAYSWLFVGRFAATPGKMLLKLKVVTADGGKVSYARALGRSAGHLVSGMTCLIGYIIAAFDDEKRALHDYMCNTRVVYK